MTENNLTYFYHHPVSLFQAGVCAGHINTDDQLWTPVTPGNGGDAPGTIAGGT
ncbi:hypothetical protein J7438_10445 [Thalassotalea sp. G20_0]|uniref:hypothetical protein n=1 Tax=Thalassotalea sp. G20_0 TaxID=2821093 RepID=UPI001ADC1828|nr:hypothetical protein [Thalassotalea sp. G20_0]MBO9494504.1 hypothetical protein [Thalassotalea sp. G20_0]